MRSRILIAALTLSSFAALAQYPDYDSDGFEDPPMVEAQPGNDLGSVDQFVAPLSQYGSWVSDNGVTAFQPSSQIVGTDFTPYASQGQWSATTQGWQFQSSLPFSWATYHYGRWYQSPRYGWLWVADTKWAPSWCEWRYGGGYTGWAPIAPRHITAQPSWFFVESGNLRSRNVYRYGVGRSRAWGITASLPSRGGWGAGPSYNDWHSSYGSRPRQPQVSSRDYGRGYNNRDFNRAPPPPPTYRPPGRNGGSVAMPPPPQSYSNNGGGRGGGRGRR